MSLKDKFKKPSDQQNRRKKPKDDEDEANRLAGLTAEEIEAEDKARNTEFKRSQRQLKATAAGIGLLLLAETATGGGVGGAIENKPAPTDKPTGDEDHPITHEYTVQPGDRTWNIAKELVGPDGDPRAGVSEISSLNGEDFDPNRILPGQTIILPGAGPENDNPGSSTP